ncbi:MAG: exodeoxyribonuclease-3 [Candidatus Paceibacteria bacterium]|jgi:exodeoxyribonuclease-3
MKKNLRLISWNVNGIRAWEKKGMLDWFVKESPDFMCFQETKANKEQLSDDLIYPEGYHSFFESSKVKKGYSGVAIYSKHEPDKVEEGLGVKSLDQEGRFLALHFGDLVVITCYFPNGGGGPIRLKYKLEYYDAFLKYVEKLKTKKKKVIFCGDVNTAHEEIDLARPKANKDNTGFLPIERAWMDKVEKKGWVDTFRYKNKDKKARYSYWDMKSRARDRNVGWRIDYFFVSPNLEKDIVKADILDKVLGSDHCPVLLEVSV